MRLPCLAGRRASSWRVPASPPTLCVGATGAESVHINKLLQQRLSCYHNIMIMIIIISNNTLIFNILNFAKQITIEKCGASPAPRPGEDSPGPPPPMAGGPPTLRGPRHLRGVLRRVLGHRKLRPSPCAPCASRSYRLVPRAETSTGAAQALLPDC